MLKKVSCLLLDNNKNNVFLDSNFCGSAHKFLNLMMNDDDDADDDDYGGGR